MLIGINGKENINTEKQEEYVGLLKNEIRKFQMDKEIVTDNFILIGN